MVLRRNMKQKTRKGSKNEDRWLGPYTIVDLSRTSCHLKNASGKQLKAHININQLKPCHCYPSATAGTSDHIVKKYYHTCSSFILGTSSHLHGVKPSEDSSGIKSSKRRKNSEKSYHYFSQVAILFQITLIQSHLQKSKRNHMKLSHHLSRTNAEILQRMLIFHLPTNQ